MKVFIHKYQCTYILYILFQVQVCFGKKWYYAKGSDAHCILNSVLNCLTFNCFHFAYICPFRLSYVHVFFACNWQVFTFLLTMFCVVLLLMWFSSLLLSIRRDIRMRLPMKSHLALSPAHITSFCSLKLHLCYCIDVIGGKSPFGELFQIK